jgi:cytochrome c553
VKRALAAALLCGAAGTALAQVASSYAERFQAVCAACHGAQGHSLQAGTPSLGGQPSFYAITQLFLFRAGRRDNALMTAVAKGFSDADLRGFADHIATLPPPPPADETQADTLRLARGQALAQRHHCLGCHGNDLAGAKQVPRLAHQREDYLQQALRGFRAGTRLGYTNAMGEALAGLAAQDLDDLAHYLAYLPR